MLLLLGLLCLVVCLCSSYAVHSWIRLFIGFLLWEFPCVAWILFLMKGEMLFYWISSSSLSISFSSCSLILTEASFKDDRIYCLYLSLFGCAVWQKSQLYLIHLWIYFCFSSKICSLIFPICIDASQCLYSLLRTIENYSCSQNEVL